jgi:hypothetical protein
MSLLDKDFIATKAAQWERFSTAQPGLQLVRNGRGRSTFMLVKSTEEFYEGVLIGQLPTEKQAADQIGRRTHYRASREDEKLLKHRTIDLDDDQINQILERWSRGQSAAGLVFVPRVFGRGD